MKCAIASSFDRFFLINYCYDPNDTEGEVGSAFHMQQQVMKFREFITGGNSASVSSMCRAAVLAMAVLIPGAVGTGPVYWGVLNILKPD